MKGKKEAVQIQPFLNTLTFLVIKGMAILSTSFMSACYLKYLFSNTYKNPFLIVFLTAVLAAGMFVVSHFLEKKEKTAHAVYTVYFSLIATYAQLIYIDNTKDGLIWLLILSLFIYLFNQILKIQTDRAVNASSALTGILFGIIVFLGYQLRKFGRLEFLYFSEIQDTAILSTSWYLLYLTGQILMFILLLRGAFSMILKNDFSEKTEKRVGKEKKVKSFALVTGAILLCWVPFYVVYFPGITSADSLFEILLQTELNIVHNENPIIHQWMIRLALEIGKLFGGNNQTGVAIYSAMQMILMASVFSSCILLLKEMKAKKAILIAVFCYSALFPVNPFYSISMWKDIPFAGFTLLLMILLLKEEFQEKQSAGQQVGSAVFLIVVSFCFCTFRHNGYYAFLAGFPLYILFSRKRWKKMIIVFAATLLLFSGYQKITTGATAGPASFQTSTSNSSIQSGGAAMTVPVQQIARVVVQHGAEADPEEFEVLREVFKDGDVEVLEEVYKSYLADPVMHCFRSSVFRQDPIRYTKAWISLGLKHPVTYIESFLLQSYGYWYPNVQYWIVISIIDNNELGIHFGEHFSNLRLGIRELFDEFSTRQPVTFLYSIGLMIWLLLISAIILLLKGQGRCASPMILLLMVWGTTILSPVYAEYRYIYGVVISAPLFFSLALALPNNNSSRLYPTLKKEKDR